MGKGSTRRPAAIDRTTEDENWARTFGAKQPATWHCTNCDRTFSEADPAKMCRCWTTHWRLIEPT